MIVGLVVLIALVVIRLNAPASDLVLPSEITLPNGAVATAFTQGRDWYAVVTQDDIILIYDRDSGALMQEISVTSGQ